MSIIRINNAHKYYNRGKGNELHVMNDISLELPESGMIAIFGKSGCGKTTLLNAIGGLDRIQSGSIELFGQSIREDTDTVRNKYIGYIFQNYNLNVADTVYENVAAALRLCGMTDEEAISERVMTALAHVGMDKYRDRTPDTLSGGQQQRVAIARAIVKNPAIILADEPTGNLDEANTVLVMDILKRIAKNHLVLLVTHEAELVDFYCDRVIEIVDGRIAGERINRDPRGYVRRDKNDIFLGELTRSETTAPGVKLEYYGEPLGELTLRVVNVEGKLYLKADGAPVKLLDEGSEIRLREGVFTDTPAADRLTNADLPDMAELSPVAGKHYGRLYHTGNAFRAGLKENFSKKRKRGKRLLRVCLFMLAVVMVFMTATIGAGIQTYVDTVKDHNEALFYIPVEPGMDYSELNAAMGSNGMDYARLIGAYPQYDTDYVSFNSSVFMTGESIRLSDEAYAQDITHASSLPLVAGAREGIGPYDILLTTALADKLLATSTVDYISDYEDLVGLISRSYYTLGDRYLRIAGVVASDEVFYYMDTLTLTEHVLNNYFQVPITAASHVGMELQVEPGEFVYLEDGYMQSPPVVGKVYSFFGMELTLAQIFSTSLDLSEYVAYVEKTYGQVLPMIDTSSPLDYALLLGDYMEHLPAYAKMVIEARPAYQSASAEEWMLAEYGHLGALASILGVDPLPLCAAALYHAEHGEYPTDDALNDYLSDDDMVQAASSMASLEPYYSAYDSYLADLKYDHYNGVDACYILSDEDYARIISTIGPTSEELGIYSYDKDFVYEDYHSHHLMIRSSDPAATEAYLTSLLGRGSIITPTDMLEEQMETIRVQVLLCVVGVLVVLALMCLCVYFIMRASFMSRVREVGILRAIGVTRRNLTYRFAVETVVLVGLTLLPGYLLSSYFIASLSGATLFSTVFFFPPWLFGGLLAIIGGASLFFGILPALVLLRRTPSEILSKYDI